MGFPLSEQFEKLTPWILGLAVTGVLGVTVSVYLNRNNASPKTPAKSAPVVAVVALGRIEPQGEVIKLSVPNAQDSRVNQILVKEGNYVKANQVIAVLQGIDRRKADLRDAEVDVRLRQAELAKVQQGEAKQAEITAQRAVVARLEAQLQTGTQQKEAAIASAEATFYDAQLTDQRRQTLAQTGAISRASRDEAQRDLATAKATLAERRAELAETVTTLQAEITQEQARLSQLKEVRPVDIEIAQAQLVKAKIAVEQQKANLEDVQVRVPIAGQILRINTRVGEQVNTSQGIVELARIDQMVAIAEVSETDVGEVHKGQRAKITSEYGGFAGEIQGTVEQIGLQIGRRTLQDAASASSGSTGNPTTDQNARIVAVKVRIDAKDSPKVAALTYMQVRVKLNLANGS